MNYLATIFALALGAMSRHVETDRPIVVVDDDPDDLALIRTLLAKAGGLEEIIAFKDADLAIEQLAAFAGTGTASLPLALIFDLKLPGRTGMELLEWTRNHRAFDRVPVVILTSSEDPAQIARAAELGAQCYLGKYPPVPAVQELAREIESFRVQPGRSHTFAVSGNRLPRATAQSSP